MEKVSVCIVLASATLEAGGQDYYKTVYKPLASYLYKHSECKFSFIYGGPQLVWLKKKHPEFLSLVAQLAGKKQVEILGGGYYDPVFPLLSPSDRSGQIELLSSELRQVFGKRPRGMTLCASCWDTSLISGFQTCGMEYVLLDSALIPPKKQRYLPIITSEKGKYLTVLPYYEELLPDIQVDPAQYADHIADFVCASAHNDSDDGCGGRIVTLMFTPEQVAGLMQSGWFEQFLQAVAACDKLEFTLPGVFVRNARVHVPGYIPAGMCKDIAGWSLEPYTQVKPDGSFPVTIHDFLETYPLHHALYDRMFYVSMLISQTHGDKMRKKAAHEKLLEAQNGSAFVCQPLNVAENAEKRRKAFSSLIEAEKLIRESTEFHESITVFDYNGDGLNEYICQMNQYTAGISPEGGAVFSLDIMKNAGNYTDTMRRLESFDGVADRYFRGLFVDHLMDTADFENYLKGRPCGREVFACSRYEQTGFSSQRREIYLCAKGEFSSLREPVSLRKNYMLRSEGFSVQYIIKNESPLSLDGVFVVECNLAQPDSSPFYTQEFVAAGKRMSINGYEQPYTVLPEVSVMQVADSSNGLSFILEPNENCRVTTAPVIYRRPAAAGRISDAGMSYMLSLFWDVHLGPGMEIEKTVNFNIYLSRRRSSKQKTQA